MIVAVRQALDYKSTARAITVCIVGFLAYALLLLGAALFLGLGAFVFGGLLSRGVTS